VDGSVATELEADLFVDASGRGSRTPVWLEELGYQRPPETKMTVDTTYVTRSYRREPHQLDGRPGTNVAAFPGSPRSGFLLAQENNMFIFRDHHAREHIARRELYGQYLASLSLAAHQLRDLRRPGPLTAEERMRRAGGVLSESGAYQLRHQMLIAAPDILEEPTAHAFTSIRRLRDRFDEPDVCTDPQWDSALDAVSDAIATLQHAMRDDLAKPS
jgi:hypothetical protein